MLRSRKTGPKTGVDLPATKSCRERPRAAAAASEPRKRKWPVGMTVLAGTWRQPNRPLPYGSLCAIDFAYFRFFHA
jgi:hypothetical protein